ncbi:MAG: HAD family hydrolase [Clostridia bacterium]|nr:HAD family hydrolase [Clostridia bacterium]
MKYTDILWDFNGTILDDVGAGIISVNKLLSERGLKTISGVEEYHKAFGFPIIEYYKRLGFDFKKESYETLAPLWVEQYLINVRSANVFDDVLPTLESFRDMGMRQTIISATELGMLKRQLKDLGIENVFDEVMGLDNIHAESKVALAKVWKEKNQSAKALMIGDTVHDVEVAKEIGADCVLVARGHQSRQVLEGCGVKVFSDLKEVLEEYDIFDDN